MIITSEEDKERLHLNVSKCGEMLQVVDIKIGVKQCMEKINKDKIPFKDEARSGSAECRLRKTIKQVDF